MRTLVACFLLSILTLCDCGKAPSSQPATFAGGFHKPYGLARDGEGNFYVADRGRNQIVKIAPNGTAAILVKEGLNNPTGVAVDHSGNIYIADADSGTVKRLGPTGAITNVASGLCKPHDLVLDGTGNIMVTGTKCSKIYRITQEGKISVLAGKGQEGYLDGPSAQALFKEPHGVAVDANGVVYVGDSKNGRVRKIENGKVSTLAEGLKNPQNLAVDGAGNVYVSDVGIGLKKITPEGQVSLITDLCRSPRGLALANGTIYVVDGNAIRKVELAAKP